MGHIVGEIIATGKDLNSALRYAKSRWSENPDFINAYSQENIAHLMQEKIIVTDKIDSSKRVYKKDLNKVEDIRRNNYPDTNQIMVLPLGTFAWNRYDGELVKPKTKTSKKYGVIAGFPFEYVENNPDAFLDKVEFVKNKKVAEEMAMQVGFDHVDSKREGDFYNGQEQFLFNYELFLKNFPKEKYFTKNKVFDDIFIINEKGKILNQVKIEFNQSKNKLSQMTSYNKEVRKVKAFMFTFDGYIG